MSSDQARDEHYSLLWLENIDACYDNPRERPEDPRARLVDAVDFVLHFQTKFEQALERGNRDDAFAYLQRANTIWQVLTMEFAGWITEGWAECQPELRDPKWMKRPRPLLRHLLEVQDKKELRPPATHPLDPVPVLLPRWLHEELQTSLEALDRGEVRPLVEHLGGRGFGYSKLVAKLQVVIRIRYEHGTGKNLGQTRKALARKLGLHVDTPRAWEQEELPKRIPDLPELLSMAERAGKLSAELAADPTYCEKEFEYKPFEYEGPHVFIDTDFDREDRVIPSDELRTLIEAIRKEPLEAFAKRCKSILDMKVGE